MMLILYDINYNGRPGHMHWSDDQSKTWSLVQSSRIVRLVGSQVAGHPAGEGVNLANVLMTYELARRLDHQAAPGITVNAFDPGMMPGTGLARDCNPILRLLWKYVLPLLTFFRPGVNRVEVSGAALAHLVLAPDMIGKKRQSYGRRAPNWWGWLEIGLTLGGRPEKPGFCLAPRFEAELRAEGVSKS